MDSVYFDDGYNQSGYVAAAAHWHGSLRFRFRPALVEERSELGEAARRLRPQLYDRQAAQFLAHKLLEWDAADLRGEPVPISAAALLRLHPEIFQRLHDIVLGTVASEIDPLWSAAEGDRQADAETTAVLAGRSVGEVREEQDEKN